MLPCALTLKILQGRRYVHSASAQILPEVHVYICCNKLTSKYLKPRD